MSSWRKRCILICMRRQDDDETTSLDYRHSSLENVPSDVFTHERTLEELFLDSNRIRDLPRELFYCHSLRSLHLADNELVEIPAVIGSLVNLEELDISRNALINLPENIGACKGLTVLEASVNLLVRVPEGITRLVGLTELYLNDSFLESLPSSFGRLNRLKVLELRENRLQNLPNSLSALTQLHRLDIGTNDFFQLPESLGSLVNLQELWCDNNRLTSINRVIGNLQQLVFIDASKNCIEWIAPDIENCAGLTDIHLSANKLQQLPESIGNLNCVTTLKLNDNCLVSLPSSIGGLVSLTELDVSCNNLEQLPSGIGLLRQLRTFYADDNFLTSLPAELGSCMQLTILSVRTNNLTQVPDEIGRIPHLHVLNLSDNKIHNLPFGLTKLKELTALWLADSQTKPLVKLQTESDPVTGQRTLTCYLLPQQSTFQSDDESDAEIGDNFQPSARDQKQQHRQIQFEFDEISLREQSSLQRTPTPYPKELKRRLQRRRDQAMSDHLSLSAGNRSASDSMVRGRRSQRQSAGQIAIDGRPDVSRSKPTSPISGKRHVLLQADREKLLKDKARLQHGTSDSNIGRGQEQNLGRRSNSTSVETHSLIVSPPRPATVIHQTQTSTISQPVLGRRAEGAGASPQRGVAARSPGCQSDSDIAKSPERSIQTLSSEHPSLLSTQQDVDLRSGSKSEWSVREDAADNNGNARNGERVRSGVSDRSLNRVSNSRLSASVEPVGAVISDQESCQQPTNRNDVYCSMQRAESGSHSGQPHYEARGKLSDLTNANEHLDLTNNNTEHKPSHSSPVRQPQVDNFQSSHSIPINADDGIAIMPYAEFVKTLTAKGVAPPRGIVRRDVGSTMVPRYVVHHHRQQQARVRSLRRHGYESEDGRVVGRRHGYESDHSHSGHRRHHGNHGYDSDVGYRSDVTGCHGNRAVHHSVRPNSSICSADGRRSDWPQRRAVFHSDQDVRAPETAPLTASQFSTAQKRSTFERNVREPITEEMMEVDGTWVTDSSGRQSHGTNQSSFLDGQRPRTFAQYAQYSQMDKRFDVAQVSKGPTSRRRNYEPIEL